MPRYNQGIGNILTNAGAPSAGTSEVQTLTIGGTPTGGTFKLKGPWGGISAAITWTATDATLVANVQAALDALPGIGAGNSLAAAGTVSSGIGTITITFQGALAKLDVPQITIYSNSLTGTSPTLAMATTTPGVNATARGAAKGAVLSDTTNGKLYINTGTTTAPTWTVVGSQS